MSNKEIKMNFKKETKRCVMPKSYTEFKQMISKCYSIAEKEINNLLISYTDDEDDKVLITSDFDFEQAIIFMEKQKLNILRINIDIAEKSENFEVVDKSRNSTNNTAVKESPKEESKVVERPKEEVYDSFVFQCQVDELRNAYNLTGFDDKEIKKAAVEAKGDVDMTFKILMEKSLATQSKIIMEEVKEEQKVKDENDKTLSIIAIQDTERNVNKMAEICNKVEESILEKFENMSKKTGIVESKPVDESKVSNFEKLFEKVKNMEVPVEIKPIKRNKPNKEKKEKSEDSKMLEKFEAELKSNISTFLDDKFKKMKSKIEKKTVKKSKELLKKFMKTDPVKSNVVHAGVTCDGCGVFPVVGSRFKCAVCHNFDYCANCEEKNKEAHPHPFVLIRTPERAPHSIQCVVREDCPIIQKSIPFNGDYKLADAIINNSIIAEVSELSSQCLTSNLDIVSFEDAKEILKTIKLKNNGVKSWPKPVYLTCVAEASTITGPSVPIKLKIESGKENNVEIKLNNKDLKAGDYVSVWQLQNEKKESFGEKIALKVKVEKKVEVKPVEPERPKEEIFDSFVFQCQVEELKNAYNLRGFDDKQIKKAVAEAKGDIDVTFQILQGKK